MSTSTIEHRDGWPASAFGDRPAQPTLSIGEADAIAELARLSRKRPVWLRVGQLIDGISSAPLRDANVVFDAAKILFVGSDGRTPEPAHLAPGQHAPDMALPDHTLLPMLIEAHAHLFLDGAPIGAAEREAYLQQPREWMLDRARARMNKLLESGIAAVRDAGDKHGVGLALAAEAKQRRASNPAAQRVPFSSNGEPSAAAATSDAAIPTPWIDSPGAAIHRRGRYGSFMAEPLDDFATPDDCVAARVAAGADRIKLLATGIINFKAGRVTAPPQMSADEVAALVRAAGRHGRQTFAHASGADGIQNAIDGGVTTVEHGFFITPDQLARMRDHQIAWVPTFAPVQLQIDRAADLGWGAEVVDHLARIIAAHRQMLEHAQQIGVPLVAGSDAGSCGVPHALGLLAELVHMERAGLAPMSVLQSATATSARVLDFPEPIGQVTPGHRPRMILTTHDPLATVANLQREKTIFFDGHAIPFPADVDLAGL